MNAPARVKRTYKYLGLLAFITLLLLLSTATRAQAVLSFKRVVNNWPTIELYIQVSCNGGPDYNFNKKNNFAIRENGREIEDFSLWCPDARIRCAVSIGFVFDASGGMTPELNAQAKVVGNSFIDLMDGLVDESALLFFSDTASAALGMTTNLTDLHTTVNELPALGKSGVWDGIYEGLRAIINSGNNPCRAVVAVIGTNDNYSVRTPQEVAAYALAQKIRIYTIGLGPNASIQQLKMLAALSGGTFYQDPGPNDMVRIYEDISKINLSPFLECLITYQARCMDGTRRDVELDLKNYCNGRDTRTKSYIAPRDTNTYTPLVIAIADTVGYANQEVALALSLRTPINRDVEILPAVFEIKYEMRDLEFQGLEATGTLFEGKQLSLEVNNGHLRISSDESHIINRSGDLFRMLFKLSDPDDTTCSALEFTRCSFQGGCIKPIVVDGEVCITPRSPRATCTLRWPDTLKWNAAVGDYEPRQAIMEGLVFNNGVVELRNARFRISYDNSVISLRSPYDELQKGSPTYISPGGSSRARWNIRAMPQERWVTTRVTITMEFDNHKTIDGSCLIHISPTGASKRINNRWEDSTATAGVVGVPHIGTLPKRGAGKGESTELRNSLAQNTPNPFNPTTSIAFSLAEDAHVKLQIFDILGHKVKTLVDGYRSADMHRVRFNAGEFPSGIYLYKLETANFTQVRRMIISR
jgi:Mg-chelatase subunit ChlD